MNVNKELAKKAKTHTVYTLADGTRVPGVTTVLAEIAKPALIAWANKLGLQGIEVGKYTDAAANVGTACHAMIEAYLKGEEFDGSDFDKITLDLAENGFLKFLDWANQHTIDDIHAEMPLVSENYKYGGTIDLYCILDGIPTLVDFKTSASGIYDEMEWQVAGGYRHLLVENKYPVEQVIIIRVGKSDQPDLETKIIGNWNEAWNVFLSALDIYYAKKAYEKAKGRK